MNDADVVTFRKDGTDMTRLTFFCRTQNVKYLLFFLFRFEETKTERWDGAGRGSGGGNGEGGRGG